MCVCVCVCVCAESGAGADSDDIPEGPNLAEERDCSWVVLHEEYHPGGRFAWIFAPDEELSATVSGQSIVLGTLLTGLYHTRVAVVSSCLTSLNTLINQGWFVSGAMTSLSRACRCVYRVRGPVCVMVCSQLAQFCARPRLRCPVVGGGDVMRGGRSVHTPGYAPGTAVYTVRHVPAQAWGGRAGIITVRSEAHRTVPHSGGDVAAVLFLQQEEDVLGAHVAVGGVIRPPSGDGRPAKGVRTLRVCVFVWC